MNSRALAPGTKLQGGKYTIEKELGQGGFGITYLAENTMLQGKVAIKEFFFKDVCVRDEQTSHVTISTEGQREMVEKFKQKFIKEARNLFKMSHPHIVRILDIFEENDTAYFVMEYAQCGSLSDKIKRDGPLSEPLATRYIMQIAEALSHVHSYHINHLDVKPANIMLSDKDEAILIDFGLSKQYDAETGDQTSTAPAAISEGFAPMEQYKRDGVAEFSPQTDIYALGATFYMLLTGQRPASASDVYEDGLSTETLEAKGVSRNTIDVILRAMQPRKKDRFASAVEFMGALKCDGKIPENTDDKIDVLPSPADSPTNDSEQAASNDSDKQDNEATMINEGGQKIPQGLTPYPKKPEKTKSIMPFIIGFLITLIVIGGGYFIFSSTGSHGAGNQTEYADDDDMDDEEDDEETEEDSWEEANKKWLDKVAKEEGAHKTESGLVYKVLQEGYGSVPDMSSKVRIHYEGSDVEGTVFDSSYERDEPIEVGTNQVIQGYAEALCMMPVGSKWEVYIPSELAYGSYGAGSIKPNSTLKFVIELLDIVDYATE